MPLPVSLDEIVNQLEILGDEVAVYVNRKTGEVTSVFLPDLIIVEDGREGEEELEWGAEALPTLRSIAETEDWVCLPDKFEIHEWEIMRRFADTRSPRLSAELRNAIHGRGAFRMFKDAVYRHGIEETWFEFRTQQLRRIAAEALEAEGIPYR
jgi:hypothetical protein